MRRYLQDPALRYLGGAVAWGLATFALLRLGWVERHLLLPFTAFQERVACALLGDPTGPISIGLSCSAADVIALCMGAVLAYPVAWRRRLAGALTGLLLIVALNTVRIGTLGLVAADPPLFRLLHIYVWPGVLVAAVTLFAFLWMRGGRHGVTPATRRLFDSWASSPGHPLRRFALWGTGLVVVYLVLSEALQASSWTKTAAIWVSHAAAWTAGLLTVPAEVSGNIFRTPHGAFLVTPACILTPLIPVYLAAVLALPLPRGRRIGALLAAPALFFVLGTARLLVLALPQTLVRSHLTALHAFYQVLLGALVVIVLAWTRRAREPRWTRRGTGALAAGVALGLLLGPLYTRALQAIAGWIAGVPFAELPDPQGALQILPAFQVALGVALWLAAGGQGAWRATTALASLTATQLLLLILAAGAWARLGLELPPLQVRAWAIAAPVVAAWLALRHPSRPQTPRHTATATASR